MTIFPVSKVLERLPGATLLALAKGKKNPVLPSWQEIRQTAMADPAYRATLNHGCNLGVSLGAVSGGLCALDFDTDEDADAFLAVNDLSLILRTGL